MHSTKDKMTNNDSETFESSRNNLYLKSHSESRTFESLPMPYACDNNIRKSDISGDSPLTQIAQDHCGKYGHVRKYQADFSPIVAIWYGCCKVVCEINKVNL